MPVAERPGWEGLVVLAAGVPWDGPWMSEKRLALALSHHVPVLYVDPPRSFLSRLRGPDRVSSAPASVTVERPGLARVSPRSLPGVSRPVLRTLATAAVRRSIRSAVAELGAPADVVVAASFDDVLNATPARLRVLWGTDDWVAGAELMHLSRPWLEREEARQLARTDRVIAVSETLADRWRRTGARVDVMPNGCDADFFATTGQTVPAADVRLQGPIAGFVGHVSERIDLALLEAVAGQGTPLLLVGPVQPSFDTARWRALVDRTNVQWTGPRPTEELPGYLAHVRVGLTPYRDTEFNRSSFPLKTLEYLAAGLPVVSTDLPAARDMPPGLVQLAHGPEDFLHQVEEALVDHDEAARARRREYARSQSWAARAVQLLDHLEISPDGRTG